MRPLAAVTTLICIIVLIRGIKRKGDFARRVSSNYCERLLCTAHGRTESRPPRFVERVSVPHFPEDINSRLPVGVEDLSELLWRKCLFFGGVAGKWNAWIN